MGFSFEDIREELPGPGTTRFIEITLWIQVPPKKILYPPTCTLSAFLAADPWIHRVRWVYDTSTTNESGRTRDDHSEKAP